MSDSSLKSFVGTAATNSVAFQEAGLAIEPPKIASKAPVTEAPETEAPETTTSGSSSVLSLPVIWVLVFYGSY